VGLASWQIERRSEAVSKIERIASNYDLEKISFEEVSSLSGDSVVTYEWRKVELSGDYLADDT
jgi:cytochrome oxidase assembly protein ShyY1